MTDGTVDNPRVHEGYVYFIRAVISRLIKIGYSFEATEERIETFDTGSPESLERFALMRGSRRDEARLHVMFWEHRVKGEWFRPHVSLLDFIAVNAKGWDDLIHDDSMDWQAGTICLESGSPGDRRNQRRLESMGLVPGSRKTVRKPRPKKVKTRPISPRYGPLQKLLDELAARESK